MESTLASVHLFHQNNYLSLAVIVAVGYDYVLTFSSEVEYIWNQPWTWVSFLYILVRYLGCCFAIAESLNGTSFITGFVGEGGPVYTWNCGDVAQVLELLHVRHDQFQGYYGIYVFNKFAIVFFFAAADMVMILRAWAMYGRSRLILSILLLVFIPDIILNIIVTAITSYHEVAATFIDLDVPSLSACSESPDFYLWAEYTVILQFIPSAITFILVVVQSLRQSLQMYRATKQWQLSKYTSLLVREGVIYFLVILVSGLINLLVNLQVGNLRLIFSGMYSGALFVACYVPVLALAPRFVLSIRALYARDLRGGRVSGIDTGFGIPSLFDTGTAMVFADIGENEEL